MPISVEQVEAALARQNATLKGSGVVITIAKTKQDHVDSVNVLYSAFRHYPFNQWIMEGRPETDVDEMVRFTMRWVNRRARTLGHVLVARNETTLEPIGSVAFCEEHHSPNALQKGWEGFTVEFIQWSSIFFGRTGIPYFMFRDARVRERYNAFEQFTVEHEKALPLSIRQIHLFTIGTNPELQAKGVGKALLDSVATLANDLELPIFLETNTARLKAYYERNGYELKVTYDIPDKEKPYIGNFGLVKPFVKPQQ